MADEAPRGFGHPSRFYAQGAAKPANGLFASDPGLDWGAVLARASPKLREEVQRVCRQWSALLRDHLRSETGLRLSVPGDQQAVPVKVVDGMPLPFVESMRPFAGFEWLLLHRPAVEAAASGTRFMERQAAPIALLLGGARASCEPHEIERVRAAAEALLARLDEMRAIDRIVGLDEDVLGGCLFRGHARA